MSWSWGSRLASRLPIAWARVASEIWGEETAIRLLTANIVLGVVSLSFFFGPTVGVAAASTTSEPLQARKLAVREPGNTSVLRRGVDDGSRGTFRLQAASAPVISATLVQTIATSAWSPASPDPSGVVYLPGPDRLEVSDSEVDQTTGAGYHGVNLWQITRSGTVTDTGTTLAYSTEPTGLGHDPGTNTLFISDDNKHRVWVVKPGSDARFGTSDDIVAWIDARGYGSIDTEDPTFDPATGHLFFLDGKATEVYEIDPVNGTFGDANDVMTHFDVGHFGPADWEGLGSDLARGTLFVGARREEQIYEVTKSGSLVRIIDASGVAGMRNISGLAMAPASNGSGQMNYWIVDRAVDDSNNPQENDGKLFEISISSSTNDPPIVTNPGPKSNVVGDSVGYQIVASDPNGDAISSYGAAGLPTGLSVSGSGFISGTTTTTGTYNVTISATDSEGGTGSTAFTWTVAMFSNSVSFAPDADTFVRSDKPSAHPGSKTSFSVDGSPVKHGLLKFTVSGVGSRTVEGVKLRLYCLNASATGGEFFRVTNNAWQENSVTWNTQPPADPTSSASLGAVSVNTWYEVDLSSLVAGDGTYSIRIASTSANGANYSTKEGASGFAPQLVVTLDP